MYIRQTKMKKVTSWVLEIMSQKRLFISGKKEKRREKEQVTLEPEWEEQSAKNTNEMRTMKHYTTS